MDAIERKIREAVEGHTPGPWEATGKWVRHAESHIEICQIAMWFSEYSRNAHLIAAAPTLLALLDAVRAEQDEALTALRWYASPDTWSDPEAVALSPGRAGFVRYDLESCPIAKDNGKLARDLLRRITKEAPHVD